MARDRTRHKRPAAARSGLRSFTNGRRVQIRGSDEILFAARPSRETALVDRLVRYLNRLPSCRVRKTHGSVFASGWPDLVGTIQGRMIALEVKRAGEKPTPLQVAELDLWRRAGAYAVWVDNFDDAVACIQEIRRYL